MNDRLKRAMKRGDVVAEEGIPYAYLGEDDEDMGLVWWNLHLDASDFGDNGLGLLPLAGYSDAPWIASYEGVR